MTWHSLTVTERSHQRSSRIWNGGNATNAESEENYDEKNCLYDYCRPVAGIAANRVWAKYELAAFFERQENSEDTCRPGMGERSAGPWGPLFSPSVIASDCSIGFPSIGYQVLVQNMDNNCRGSDLRAVSQGGSNVLNQVNIGLFVGHSVAGRDQELSIGHLQSYVPIYNSTTDAMDFVKLTEMFFGSPNLSWMAFYSCNLLRDSSYRPNGIYDEVKNHFALPMNTYLHALQAFATENTVHPSMVYFWTKALSRKTRNPSEHTVLGAWRYVCLTTQPKESGAGANVSRSVYWPECVDDYIYGWGPQTEPDRDPEDPLEHVFLLEDDQITPAQ